MVEPRLEQGAEVLERQGHEGLTVVVPCDREGQVALRSFLMTCVGVLDGLLVGPADVWLSAPLALHMKTRD